MQSKIEFEITVVYTANDKAAEKVVVNQGGTSSSKTFSIMQLLFTRAIQEPGVIITVVGESIPNLKKGAYRDSQNIYNYTPDLKQYIEFWNKSDRIIYMKNGSLIEFISCEDEQSAKNGKRDYLFVNEANGIEYLVYWQLAIRTRKQIFIDYNPTAPFWAHDNLIGREGTRLIISDHRHNRFLTKAQHAEIENIPDPELHKVYARGLTGNITGIIYPSWVRIPDNQFPYDCDNMVTGADWGYTNDPTAIVMVARQGNTIYLHELCYEPDVPSQTIKDVLKLNQMDEKPLYCDHDPDLISDLRRKGLKAMPARKGPGSIRAGIMKMKEFKVCYTESSVNIAEERKRYIWIKDPKTGKPTNEPIDKFNHLMDATRYAVYTHYYKAA